MLLEPLGSIGVRSSAGSPKSSGACAVASVLRRSLALGCALIGLASCELGENFGDLGQQLLDPEVQGIEVPGRRWVEGPHYNLTQLSDEAGKRYALALNADSELVIVDFESENFCRAGQVLRYGDAVTARSRPALLPVLVSRDAGPDEAPELLLSFVTFDCQRTAFAVKVAGLPSQVIRNLPSGSGTALLVRADDGGLVTVDPWAETVTRIAGQVRDLDPVLAFGRYLWVDSGVIVLANDRLEPVVSFGQRVVAVTGSPEDAQLAYIEAPTGDTQGGTLFTIDARGQQEPREIATDVCAMQYLTLGERRKLSYLSPCAERQLVLRDVLDDSLQVIDTNVAGLPVVRRIANRPVLTYITTPSRDATQGTLWAVDGDAAKVAIAEDTRVGPSTVTSDGGLLTVLDWANTGGRLVEWRGDGVTEVAQGVIELAPLGRMDNDDLTLLGNFDGTTGDLLWLRSDLSTELLASGVPTRAANDRAFIANSDGDSGDLLLLDRSDGSTESLASGVGRGAFIFTQQFNAVMMLSRPAPDARSNTLRVRLLRSKREYVLHEAVTEAREVAFPNPGVLYNVVAGDDAGIWFAKAL
ncbi:MAG TPA: hypothetical protein VNN80_16400 [Polyangiaceae bacterium]|nr:hypothetical protein [Polyangiaceae bacterium]